MKINRIEAKAKKQNEKEAIKKEIGELKKTDPKSIKEVNERLEKIEEFLGL